MPIPIPIELSKRIQDLFHFRNHSIFIRGENEKFVIIIRRGYRMDTDAEKFGTQWIPRPAHINTQITQLQYDLLPEYANFSSESVSHLSQTFLFGTLCIRLGRHVFGCDTFFLCDKTKQKTKKQIDRKFQHLHVHSHFTCNFYHFKLFDRQMWRAVE